MTGPDSNPLIHNDNHTAATTYSSVQSLILRSLTTGNFQLKHITFSAPPPLFYPCILISLKSFIYQQMHFISVLENIKTYIKIAPTCFGLRPSSENLHKSLAKATFIKSVKVRRYGMCRCGSASYIKSMVVCVLCRVKTCTAHSVFED